MGQRIKMYPTEYEVTIDWTDTPYAKFKAFDDESFEVEVKTITTPDELRKLADMLEIALVRLKNGDGTRELEHKMSVILDIATGSRLSKPNTDLESIKQAIHDREVDIANNVEEECKELYESKEH